MPTKVKVLQFINTRLAVLISLCGERWRMAIIKASIYVLQDNDKLF